MVVKCCVDSCSNHKRPNLVFHRFPLGDPDRLRQWLLALTMDVNTPLHVVGKLFICQKHFLPENYHRSLDPSVRARLLKPTAVPTQFIHTRLPDTGDSYSGVIDMDELVSKCVANVNCQHLKQIVKGIIVVYTKSRMIGQLSLIFLCASLSSGEALQKGLSAEQSQQNSSCPSRTGRWGHWETPSIYFH